MPTTSKAEKSVILALRKFIQDTLAGGSSNEEPSEKKSSARAKTPYMLFCAAKRGEITEALTKLEGQNPRSAMVTKKLGEIWSKMSEEERQPFVDESEKLKREPVAVVVASEEESKQ